VTLALCRQGFETFLPVLKEIHRWSDRRKRVDVPLFSGYTFAQFTSSSLQEKAFLRITGIIGLIHFGGEPATVPSKQIDDLHLLLSQDVPFALYPFLKVGRRVRIRGGCLDGLEGILEKSQEDKLIISIESIQRSLSIRIEGYDLDLL
jgi:transcription termination/antitermination protein NusG